MPPDLVAINAVPDPDGAVSGLPGNRTTVGNLERWMMSGTYRYLALRSQRQMG